MAKFNNVLEVMKDVRTFSRAIGGEDANVSSVLAWDKGAADGRIVGIPDETDPAKMADQVADAFLITFSYDDRSKERRFTRRYTDCGNRWEVCDVHPRRMRSETHPA